MRETLNLRILEARAAQWLQPTDGVVIGDGRVRSLDVSSDDPLFALLTRAERAFRAKGEFFISSWSSKRTYTKAELLGASAFEMSIKTAFEPEGEACGTRYHDVGTPLGDARAGDWSGPLWLQLSSIPPAADIARSIGGEIVISHRCAKAFLEGGLTGFRLCLVYNGKASDKKHDQYQAVLADERLAKRARREDIKPGTDAYLLWVNEHQQSDVLDEVLLRVGLKTWPLGPRVRYGVQVDIGATVSADSRFGNKPFDTEFYSADDPRRDGYSLGLNLVSELHLEGKRPTVDLAATRQTVGVRSGVLRLRPLLVASPRLRSVVEATQLKGFIFDVAHVG